MRAVLWVVLSAFGEPSPTGRRNAIVAGVVCGEILKALVVGFEYCDLYFEGVRPGLDAAPGHLKFDDAASMSATERSAHASEWWMNFFDAVSLRAVQSTRSSNGKEP